MPRLAGQPSFFEVLTAAVSDFALNGYDSTERLDEWLRRLRDAAEAEALPEHEVQRRLRDVLGGIYERLVERGGLLKRHPGVGRFTLERAKPALRAELDRRIAFASSLIKLNRPDAVERMLRRFAGWATSVPVGGSEAVDRVAVKTDVRKAFASLSYIDRRCSTDQGMKLIANLSEILAVDGGAIAVKWNSHWRRPGYNYRVEHKERDGKIYAIRGNWALDAGLMKAGPPGYYDEVTSFGQEVYCSCYGTWLSALRDLPPEMITRKGREELERVRREIAA